MMRQLDVRLKRLGKRRVRTVSYAIEGEVDTLRALLRACVTAEVARYNRRQSGEDALAYLLPAQIEERARAGKVHFDTPVADTPRLADPEQAVANAELAFTDGLFAAFLDDTELTKLEQPVALTSKSTLTFIRMTFLSGSYH